MQTVPTIEPHRVAGVARYLELQGVRIAKMATPRKTAPVLRKSLDELRQTCIERVQRPFFAELLSLSGDEPFEVVCARFAALRRQLGLAVDPEVDAQLALEQVSTLTYH